MQFSLEEKFGPKGDGALHVLRPFLPRIHREGTHPFPRVQVPTAPEAAPPALLVSVLGEPFEGSLHGGMIGVAESHQRTRHVPGRAEVAFLRAVHGEAAVCFGEPAHPQVARLRDPRIFLGQPEIGQDEEHPVGREIFGPVEGLLSGPPSSRILCCEDLRSPSGLRDRSSRGDDVCIILHLPSQPLEGEVADRGLVFLQQPV